MLTGHSQFCKAFSRLLSLKPLLFLEMKYGGKDGIVLWRNQQQFSKSSSTMAVSGVLRLRKVLHRDDWMRRSTKWRVALGVDCRAIRAELTRTSSTWATPEGIPLGQLQVN